MKRKRSDIIDYVSPSSLKNYILKDTIIDYFEYFKINNLNDKPNRFRRSDIKNNNFENIIKEKGIDFEKLVMSKFPCSYLTINDNNSVCMDNFYKTIKALKNKTPVIYQGVLYDDENQTYGSPDLIIIGEYLNDLFDQNVNPDDYYIVDIKFSTIKLSSDDSYILNSDFVPVFKSQILIYTKALNNLLNQNVEVGFILAKRYISESKGIKNIYYNDNFDKIVSIDYKNKDSKFNEIVKDGIEWVLKLRNEGHQWSLLPKPSTNELYPNMSNTRDGKWHGLKKELAENIKELTCVLYIGPEQRNNAFKNNIYSYDHPKCNSKILKLNGDRAEIVNKILKINSTKNTDLIKPKKINFEWKKLNKNNMEFYLDYETTTDFDKNNFIYMIGVGFNIGSKWNFEWFITEDSSKEAQKVMFDSFWNYIREVLKEYNKKEANFIHWTIAEPIFYNNIKTSIELPNKNFYDLHAVFMSEQIVVKGALDYTLKTIANAMYKNKMIKTCWSSKSTCENGLDALSLAYNLYKDNKKIKVKDMKDILYYNEIDCKVLCEILNYLRINH
jgi:hypothetical protein